MKADHRFPAGSAFEACDRLLFDHMIRTRASRARPILVGLCGAQGSGKSTTAARLAKRLTDSGCATLTLSIDDFYHTQAERQCLARKIHPLLATRGVPGTHDLFLAQSVVTALLAGTGVALPHFIKARDDRAPADEWLSYAGKAEIVLLEGWCVGARPQPSEGLKPPINALELHEDHDLVWRRYVNAALANEYRDFFAMLDLRIMLRAPGFEQVLAWRTEQEHGLARGPGALPPMDEPALLRFIAHYERITRWLLEDEPADIVVPIGPDRTPFGWHSSSLDMDMDRT